MKTAVFVKRCSNKLSRIKDYINDRYIYFILDDSRFRRIKNILLRLILGNRKLVAFYGECHIYIYGGILNHMSEAKKKYLFLGSKEIEYLVKFHRNCINRKSSWDKLDVLIYNPGVPNRDGAPTLDKVLKWVPETSKRIEITNAVFKGYMPQHTEKVFENSGRFSWGDKNLNKSLSMRETEDMTLEKVVQTDYYSTEFVNNFFDKSIKHLKQYERQCTVKIADYIENHGKNRVLYYSVTHPEIEIMHEITKRILAELDVDARKMSDEGTEGLFDLHSHGEVVYPSVYYGLGIPQDWSLRRVQPGNYKEQTYTFYEYVKEYMKEGKEFATLEFENLQNEER